MIIMVRANKQMYSSNLTHCANDSVVIVLIVQKNLNELGILFYSTNMEKLDFAISMCSKLVELFLKKLNFRDHLDVICRAIKLLLTSIQRQRRETVGKPDEEKRQAMESDTINKLLRILRSTLVIDLSPTMSPYYKSDSFARELEVGRKF